MAAEPIRYVVTRYRCPFCPRGHSSRTRAVDHIGRCWYNPANRTCKTCRSFVPDQSEPDVGYNAPEYCAASEDVDLSVGSPRVNCPLWAALEEGEG